MSDPINRIKHCVAIILLVVSVQVAAQQTTTTGWMIYSDTIARDLDLTPDQQQQLQDWNARYQLEYDRFGSDGVQQKDIAPLTERRDNELRGILSEDQYERWNTMDNNRNGRRTLTTGGAPGPEMRREPPAGQQPDILDERNKANSGTGNTRTPQTGSDADRSIGTDGGTGTTGTGSATDGGNRNTVTPPTP